MTLRAFQDLRTGAGLVDRRPKVRDLLAVTGPHSFFTSQRPFGENKEEIDLATRHRLAASNERGENLGNHAAAVHRV